MCAASSTPMTIASEQSTNASEAPNDTAIIILAAGSSTRMGTPKQLLRFEGETLLRRAARTALATDCRPVVVVLGAHATKMRQELQGLDVVIVENADWQKGMAGSLRVGIETLSEEKGERKKEKVADPSTPFSFLLSPFSCLVMLCDQPFVTPALLDTLRATWRASGKPVVCCEYAGGAGVPALFDQSLFAALCGLQGAAGAKQIFARYAADTALVPFAPAAFDVDTPEEYEALTKGNAAS